MFPEILWHFCAWRQLLVQSEAKQFAKTCSTAVAYIENENYFFVLWLEAKNV